MIKLKELTKIADDYECNKPKLEVDKALKAVYTAAKVEAPVSFGTWGTNYYKGLIAYPIRETASISAAANKGNVFDQKTNINTSKALLESQMTGRNIQGSANLLNQ